MIHMLPLAKVPVTRIEEVNFKPIHPTFTGHWTFNILLEDNRQYVISFTDRQLGWLPIVTPKWDYTEQRV
jgi:hypothetical protein